MCQTRFGVLGRNHLTLLGDSQRTSDCTGRLSQNRFVTRSAATSDGSAAAVEEPQP